MKRFAVVVLVEAEDAVQAVEHALDRTANPEAFRTEAALADGVIVRPATTREREA